MNVAYLQDVAEQAGIPTDFIYIDDIGINEHSQFVSTDGNPITNIFKLYPYEWMFNEEFGRYLITTKDKCNFGQSELIRKMC